MLSATYPTLGPFPTHALFVGACRAGLTRSKCILRDTRLVLGYLGLLAVASRARIWLTLP